MRQNRGERRGKKQDQIPLGILALSRFKPDCEADTWYFPHNMHLSLGLINQAKDKIQNDCDFAERNYPTASFRGAHLKS